jgi:FkbH-like protein
MHDFLESSWIDLTSRQRQLWLGINATGDSRLFQIGAKIKVAQAIDLKLLQLAFSDVVQRHDALRLMIDTQLPRQRVARTCKATVQHVDVSLEVDPDSGAEGYIDRLFASPFNLDERSLIQLVVVSVAGKSSWLVFRAHHIVMDANSFSIIIRDVVESYTALIAGSETKRQQSTYLRFQQSDAAYMASPRYERDLQYWRDRLSNLPRGRFARRTTRETEARRPVLRRQIEHARFQRFLARCAEQKISPGNALLALSSWLLTSSRERDGLVLGVAYPGRSKEDRNSVGLFSGVMPLRVTIPDGITLPELTGKITQSIKRDYLHHRFPIDDLRQNLGPGQTQRDTLFDAIVSYMPLEVVDFDMNLGVEPLRVMPMRGSEANPLVIYISELNRGHPVALEFAFNRKFLDDNQVAAIAQGFDRTFDAFIDEPQRPLVRTNRSASDMIDEPKSSASEHEADIRIISSFTSSPIEAPLQFWLRRTGIPSTVTSAGYNQIFQELLDPDSRARRNRNGANVILLRIEDWLRERAQNESLEDSSAFLTKVADDFVSAIVQAARVSEVPYLVLICAPSPKWQAGSPLGCCHEAISERIAAGLSGVSNLDVSTYRGLRELYPVDVEYDPTGDQLGHLPYTATAFAAMATLVARRCHLLLRSPVKVIVVDCDNTIWDGVVGEDGVQGIRLSANHLCLQKRLVEAAGCGVLVCLSSKNVEEDVTAVFRERPDMLLRWENIVAHKINWAPKSENIRQLAGELNLGLDSFLFLDDNPVEVAEVSSVHPSITAIELSMSGPGATRFDHLWPLDCRMISAEDAKRAQSYRQNLSRVREREKSSDFASFIGGLGLQIRLEGPRDSTLARLEQLTERTNQFNINNVKRSAAWLNEQRATDGGAVLAVSVSDKFGDYGIVGLLAVEMDRQDLVVNTFLMSCRVLGRGVEHRMISEVGRLALKFGASQIKIPVRVTVRNLPVRQFLERIDGHHSTEATDQLHLVAPDVAANFRFSPSDGYVDVFEEGAPAAFDSSNRRGRARAGVWIEAATVYASAAEVEKALAELFCQALGLETIGAEDDFFELGVYSLLAVQLVSRIRDRLNTQLSIRTLFECSSIAKLASAIDSHADAGYKALVPLQLGDQVAPLFCCHPANGDAVCYMRLTKAIGPDQAVYGFEASGLSPGEPMARSLESMASSYVKEMISVQPNGPYNILGWSFGGALAFEIARQIHQAGGTIGLLVFMDAAAPGKDGLTEQTSITEVDEQKLLQGVTHELNTIRRYSDLPPLDENAMTWQLAIDGYRDMGIVPKDYSVEDMRRKMLVYGNCGILFNQYRPPFIRVPIVHFRATERSDDSDFDWKPYAENVRSIWIRCNHYRMGFEPNITIIGAHLRALIRGDKRALSWWRRTPLANSMERLIGRLAS